MQEHEETWVLGGEEPLEQEMATHSTILAWTIPWSEAWGATIHGASKSQTWLSTEPQVKFTGFYICYKSQWRLRLRGQAVDSVFQKASLCSPRGNRCSSSSKDFKPLVSVAQHMVFLPQILRAEDLPVAKLPSRIMVPRSQLPNPSEAFN